MVLWVKLKEAGYTRTIQGLYYVLQKLGIYEKEKHQVKQKRKKEQKNTSNISRRESTSRCKVYTNSMFNEEITRKRRKILSIYSDT